MKRDAPQGVGKAPYPLPLRPPVAGLVPFLASQLVGGLAEPFYGFQFLPHCLHVDAVHLFLGGQQVDLALPCLWGDFLAAGFQFFQIPGRRVIEDQFPAVALLEQFPLLRLHLGKLLMDSLVLVVLRPHLPALGEGSDPALGLDNLPPQVIIAAVHVGDFIVELLHGLDTVCLQKAEQSGALLQSPDFAGTGVGPLELLLGLPQVNHAGLLALRLLCLGLRPVVEAGNAGLDFLEQLVVGGDLAVDFPLVGADAALLHLAGRWPQVDRGDFINALSLVAAVVYQGGMTGGLQCPIGIGCPCRPPNLHIPFVVPVGGVLPVVLPAAFPVRDALAVFVQVVCLAALCTPCAIFFQGPDGQHDMDMGIAGSFVVDGKIGAHPLVHKFVLHIGPDKGKLLLSCQFAGQSRLDLAGKLAVPRFLDLLHTVPEGRAVCKFRRSVCGQHDFRMDNAGFAGVVMGQAVPLIRQLGSTAVGGCGNGRPALAALDDADGDMTKIHR